MPYHPARAYQLGCPATFGTHNCCQLNSHAGLHYCPCVDGNQRKWSDAQRPDVSDYNLNLATPNQLLQLAKQLGIR